MSWDDLDDLFDSMKPRAIREFSAGMGKARTYGESEVERLKRQLGELEEERDTLRARVREGNINLHTVKLLTHERNNARRQMNELKITTARLMREKGQLQAEVTHWKRETGRARRDPHYHSASALPLKKLLKLCHPDRWQGTDLEALANELTQLINTERKT